jgi:hypothetical protein
VHGSPPSQGCVQSKQELFVGEIDVFRLTMLAPTNGKWGGGF